MIRLAVLALTTLTGFAGLVYEVTWQRYLAILLGAHSQATALVLGLFLGGLALGYAYFGRLTHQIVVHARTTGRPTRLLVVYGGIECSIGLWALAFPVIFRAVQQISMGLPQPASTWAFAFDAVLCALLVVPPAMLMGGTIPILTQAMARDVEDATRWHAWVYGANALGAFAGALAAGFWLLPGLGLIGCLRAMALLNLVVGVGFVLLDRWAPSIAVGMPDARGRRSRESALAAAAFGVGLAMMTVQTVLVRVGALSLGASQFTFSMVVAVFVLAIAFGSLAVSLPRRLPGWSLVANLWTLLIMLALLYLAIDAAPYAAHVLRSLFRDQAEAFYPYHGSVLLLLLFAVGPAVLLSGACLPLLFHALRRDSSDLGADAGRLYAWNTLGSLAGALVGGYLALYWLDLHHVYRLALLAIALSAALVTARAGLPHTMVLGLVVASGLAIVMLGSWSPERLASGLFRIRQPVVNTFEGPTAFYDSNPDDPLIFYDDDPVQSVTIKERVHPNGFRNTSIATNGKGDGSLLYDYPTMALAALIPAMLAEKAERAFVIGWGTGVSAGELAALESMREVVVAEISPGVIAGAPHFAHGNLDAARNPKVRIQIGDAYRTLLRSDGLFDIILSEPSNPWVQGVEMLFSRELLEASRARLAPGGVHIQWMYLYEIDRPALELVLRTYREVFEDVSLWYGVGVDLLILGRKAGAPDLDVQRLVERSAQPDYAAGLERSGIRSVPALLAHELWPSGVLHEAGLTGEIHTLMHPRLSDLAARAFFIGRQTRLPSAARDRAAELGAHRSLLRHYQTTLGRSLSDDERYELVSETCRHRSRECLTLLAWWGRLAPESTRYASVLQTTRTNFGGERDGLVRLDRLARVAALYDVEPSNVDGGDPLLDAKQATDLFYLHYHPAAPFPRQHLEALWRRCAAESEREPDCAAARELAERHLGPIGQSGNGKNSTASVIGHAARPLEVEKP